MVDEKPVFGGRLHWKNFHDSFADTAEEQHGSSVVSSTERR